MDVEGIPDRDFYYLIGLLVCEGENNSNHSFWADTVQDEEKIWTQFLKKISDYPEVPIYHYGSFDLRAVEKLGRRYATSDRDMLKKRLVNVNSYIFSKVYFPVRSNSLKEIGKFIGATWTSPDSSGLQSLVWRHYWEEKQGDRYRQLLLVYNQEDCVALKLMVDELSKIGVSANTLSDIDFIDQPKRNTTKPGERIHSQFETILKFAHANYDKKKISFRQDEGEKAIAKEEKKIGFKKGYQGQRKIRPKATRVIQVLTGKVCPKHDELLRPTERIAKRLIIDLVLAKKGIRKTITEYVGFQGYCSKCNRYYVPPDISKYPANQLYGHRFQAWIVYQRVALRMTYGSIAEAMLEQFNENECGHTIASFITNLGHYYAETEEAIIQRLLKHPFIHVDETPINVRGVTQYVWTFANNKYVAFRLKDTREATIVREFLANYDGVLISDFYSGYDSIECRQQKCWVHLIRDLNDDLWENPFDMQYGMFVSEVRSLIIPIMEAIQKYGLKRWHLGKFMRQVGEFYKKVITDKHYESELALKYQKRFLRYRESLFTFLEQDGIPWHNNTAERALRHIAKQQQISGIFREPVTHYYLRLLGIRQACRFQGKSFLKFLMSGEKDVTKFRVVRRLGSCRETT